MENQHPQEEALNKENVNTKKKNKKKKTEQASVLKQLNNQSLYPIHERIGIYVIAALSTIGLLLIVFMGVMALVSSDFFSASNEAIDIDLNEVQNMLDDLEYILGSEDDEEYDGDYLDEGDVDYPDDMDVDDVEDDEPVNGEDDEDVDDEDDEDEDEYVNDAPASTNVSPTSGTINTDGVGLRRYRTDAGALLLLSEGYAVEIVTFEYDHEFSRVRFASTEFGRTHEIGFVRTQFIDFD